MTGWRSPDRQPHNSAHQSPSAERQRSNIALHRSTGVTEWKFSSSDDERDTDLERRLNGKTLSYAEAMKLIDEHPEEIRRSVFLAQVKF